jgi:hypothetical protein
MLLQAKIISAVALSTFVGAALTQFMNDVPTKSTSRPDVHASADAPAIQVVSGSQSVEQQPATPAGAEKPLLSQLIQDIERARERSESLSCYTAVLEMEEEIGGRLRDPEVVDLRFRSNPFSVYMTWRDSTQEALFVAGKNDDRLLIRPTKGLAAIKRVWNLEPESRVAMKSCRYSIRDTGLYKLAERVHQFYIDGAFDSDAIQCEVGSRVAHERELTEYVVEFPDAKLCDKYSKCHYGFDNETGFLVTVKNYGWGEDGSQPLLERYHYHTIDASREFSDTDFDHQNPEYGFVASDD